MKFYLSSYKLGDKVSKLKDMIPANHKCAYIPNAIDFHKKSVRDEKIKREVKQLSDLGLIVEVVDLRDYFGKKKELERELNSVGFIWVRGGNLFVLRQAMKLSGFDKVIKKLSKKEDLLYGGYSAGICVLAPTLRGIDLMDDLTKKPYGDLPIVWSGLGLIDYLIVPHYQSNHFESGITDKVVDYLKREGIKHKTLRDGEVIIIE